MPEVLQILVERPLLRTGCILGEGPLYDPATQILHFVDIAECKVFHLDTVTLELAMEQFQEPISCLALRREGPGLACVAERGFAVLEGDSSLRYLYQALPEDYVGYLRFNDGACDYKGRFFAGTLYSPERGIPGQLYRYDPSDDSCLIVDEGPFTDCNGLGWSPDGKTFYLTDSIENLIYAYDYEDGSLSNQRVFVDAVGLGFSPQTFCDGLCVDSEGGVWSARWGGSKIIRFSPEGEVDAEIYFPTVLNVTACCFGGPDGDQMYVTTTHCSANGGDVNRQVEYPDSGSIFVVDLSGKYKGAVWRHAFDG